MSAANRRLGDLIRQAQRASMGGSTHLAVWYLGMAEMLSIESMPEADYVGEWLALCYCAVFDVQAAKTGAA